VAQRREGPADDRGKQGGPVSWPLWAGSGRKGSGPEEKEKKWA
jgi:hypothetical protein